MHSAMRSRLEPFKSFVRLLRGHLDGVLAWTKLRLSNGALEGMNNKIKLVSHRAFGFRSVEHYVAAIYHCCAQLPLPQCQGRSKFGPLRRSKSRPVGEGVAVFVGRLERSLRSPFRAAQA